MGKLERAEAVELRQMRAKLSEHMDAVIALNSEFVSVSGSATTVSSGVTRAGIGRVEGEFTETVMGADRGIVDVYWTRKAQVSDEIERLGEERGLRSRGLTTGSRRFANGWAKAGVRSDAHDAIRGHVGALDDRLGRF